MIQRLKMCSHIEGELFLILTKQLHMWPCPVATFGTLTNSNDWCGPLAYFHMHVSV